MGQVHVGGEVVKLPEAREDNVNRVILRIDELSAKVKKLEETAKTLKFVVDVGQMIIIGIIVVFFVAILGFLFDYYKFYGSSYIDLKEATEHVGELQNNKLDNLEMQVTELRNLLVSMDSNPTDSANISSGQG